MQHSTHARTAVTKGWLFDKILHDKKYTNKLAIAKTATGRPPNHDSSAVTPLNTDACILEGVLEDNLKGATG